VWRLIFIKAQSQEGAEKKPPFLLDNGSLLRFIMNEDTLFYPGLLSAMQIGTSSGSRITA
jgi:hypothetical protein